MTPLGAAIGPLENWWSVLITGLILVGIGYLVVAAIKRHLP